MSATNFSEYTQEIEEILNATVASGEAALISIQIDQRSALRGYITGLLQFGDASELHFREFVDTSGPEPRLMYAYHYQDQNKASSCATTMQPTVLCCRRQNINTRQRVCR